MGIKSTFSKGLHTSATRAFTCVQILLYVYKRRVRPLKKLISQRVRRTIPWIIAIVLSAALGWAINEQSPVRVVGTFVLPVLLWLIFARTHIAMLVILLLVASFVDESTIPKPLESGGMGFFLSEFLIIVAVFAIFVKIHFDRKKDLYIHSPLTLPLIMVLGSVLFSVLVSYLNWLANPTGPFDFKTAYNWGRPMLYLLLFFIAAYSLDNEKKLRGIIGVLLLVSVVLSVMIMIQQVVGYEHPIFSQYWYRGSGDNPGEMAGNEMRLRIEAPGLHTMLMVALIAFIISAVAKLRYGIWYFAAVTVIGVALVVTWQRNYWIAAILGAVIVLLLASRRVKWKLSIVVFVWLLMVSAGFLGFATLFPGNDLTENMAARVMSVFSPEATMRTQSLQWRLNENRSAMQVIRKNPIFGIGLGNPIIYVNYRGQGGVLRSEPRYRIHNSYLMIYAVYGLPGLISCAWLSIAFLLRTFALYRRSSITYIRILAMSFIGVFMGFLFRGFFNQLPGDKAAIAIMAFMLGVIEACWRIDLQSKGDLPDSSRHAVNITASQVLPMQKRSTATSGGRFGKS